MDIDITDSAFALNMPNVPTAVNDFVGANDYSFYIYIGALILMGIACMFVYNFYMNKKSRENNGDNMDCSGGFCTMNQ